MQLSEENLTCEKQQTPHRRGSKSPMLLQVDVSGREEVMRVMDIGARNRAVAETKMNERSSRSHSVLTVIVDGISHVTGQRTHGCLHLIDLAGLLREDNHGPVRATHCLCECSPACLFCM